MVVGVLELEIQLFFSNSLKEKRRTVKSLITRIRNNFNVSASEIGHQDLWQKTLIGVAFIAAERRFSQSVLSKVVEFVKKERRISLINSKMEIF